MKIFFFGLGGNWVVGDTKSTMDRTMLFIMGGLLSYSNNKAFFDDDFSNELTDEEVLDILRGKVGRRKIADQIIREGDFVYIPHLGERLYKTSKTVANFAVRDNNGVLYSFNDMGEDIAGIRIAFKYTPKNRKLLSKLYGRRFLSKNDSTEVRNQLEDLIKNGFNILSVKEGDTIKAFTKDQIDQIVDLTSKNPDVSIIHPITGVEL